MYAFSGTSVIIIQTCLRNLYKYVCTYKHIFKPKFVKRKSVFAQKLNWFIGVYDGFEKIIYYVSIRVYVLKLTALKA